MLSLIGFFHYLDNLKLYHWITKSHSRHVASDELHKKISELIDAFIERFIGHFGTDHFFEPAPQIKVLNMSDLQAPDFLDDFIKFIRTNVVPRVNEIPELKNITDDMINEITQCKYKFTQI